MALFERFPRVILPVVLLGLMGCSQFEGLFSDDDGDKPAEEATPTASTARSGGATVKAGEGAWRSIIILDTSADHSFFAPEQALNKALEESGIRITRAWALGPVEIKNEAGEVVGTVDLATVTDQAKGYVFVEQGRPSDFVSPASLPFVLQQASAFFAKPIKMGNGRAAAAAGGGMGGGMGARQLQGGKQLGGPAGSGAAKRMKAQKGATGARKVGSRPATEVPGAGAGDASAGGASTEDATGE